MKTHLRSAMTLFPWSSLAMVLPYSIVWKLGGTHAPSLTAMVGPLLIVSAWLALSFVALRASVIAFDKAVPLGSDRSTLTMATSNLALVVVAICGSSVLILALGPHFSWATAVPSLAKITLAALFGVFLFGVARARQLAKHGEALAVATSGPNGGFELPARHRSPESLIIR